MILLTNKQTNADEDITSLAEVVNMTEYRYDAQLLICRWNCWTASSL